MDYYNSNNTYVIITLILILKYILVVYSINKETIKENVFNFSCRLTIFFLLLIIKEYTLQSVGTVQ